MGGGGGEKLKERERYMLLLKYGNLCDEKNHLSLPTCE